MFFLPEGLELENRFIAIHECGLDTPHFNAQAV